MATGPIKSKRYQYFNAPTLFTPASTFKISAEPFVVVAPDGMIEMKFSVSNNGNVFPSGRSTLGQLGSYLPLINQTVIAPASTGINSYVNRYVGAILAPDGNLYVDVSSTDVKEITVCMTYPAKE